MVAEVDPGILVLAAMAAFALAWLSAVAGFGGGVLLLPVFVALFGLRVAVPVLTLAQLVSNGSRVAFNRREVNWSLVRHFAIGAAPLALVGGLLFAYAPLDGLTRVLGAFLLVLVAWRRFSPRPPRVSERSFIAVGAASGLGSALVGSVGPLTAPFFLAYGLVKSAYIGTEAASAVIMHVSKLAAYGTGDLLTLDVVALGAALAPATMLGAWAGKRTLDHVSDKLFVLLVEVGLVISGTLLLVGL
jgi:uncharacterized membrane protein YfcA